MEEKELKIKDLEAISQQNEESHSNHFDEIFIISNYRNRKLKVDELRIK